MAHFGHFLVETLSSFWGFRSFREFDRFVLHPFAFGSDLPDFAIEVFKAFGIPKEKVYIIDRHIRLEDVTIPERLIKLNHSANTRVREVYRHLGSLYSTGLKLRDSMGPRLIYVSRVKNSLRTASRTVINEPAIERQLQQRGFRVVYPEDMTLSQQVALFATADVVCGFSGSALHNCLFMRPQSLLIDIGDARSGSDFQPMQSICNAVAQIRAVFVPFYGRVLNPNKYMAAVDVRRVIEGVDRALTTNGSLVSMKVPVPPIPPMAAVLSRIRGSWLTAKSILRMLKWQSTTLLEKLRPSAAR